MRRTWTPDDAPALYSRLILKQSLYFKTL